MKRAFPEGGLSPLAYEPGSLCLVDQRKLPLEFEWVKCCDARAVSGAIRDMVVRGAPAIGIAAAYGLALEARALPTGLDGPSIVESLRAAAEELIDSRPTAVNLAWAAKRILALAERRAREGDRTEEIIEAIEREAVLIHREDVEMNRAIGFHGRDLVRDGGAVLTHCNAGALATGGYGTALGVFRAARQQGKLFKVYVDETRPFLQGARLTAWELVQDGFDVTLIADSAAGYLMQRRRVDLVVVGADRIAANGDVANKVGTFSLAVLARENGVPFYVAAPSSTFDPQTPSGDAMVIEERPPEEVLGLGGRRHAPEGVSVANPSFDVTPNRFVTGIITERGILYPPFDLAISRCMLEANGGERDARS